MIRWQFYLDNVNFKSETDSETEDERISKFISEESGDWLSIPGDKTSVMINLSSIRFITREIFDPEEEKARMEKEKAEKEQLELEKQSAELENAISGM